MHHSILLSYPLLLAQSTGAVEYTDASLQRGKTATETVGLDTTLNKQMVSFQ